MRNPAWAGLCGTTPLERAVEEEEDEEEFPIPPLLGAGPSPNVALTAMEVELAKSGDIPL